jgi:hypothetical protein
MFALALVAPRPAAAQVPGPDRVEVLRSDGGTQVLLGGVGVGMGYARAAERLGGGGTLYEFFEGGGPIVKRGIVDGLPCHLMVLDEETGRVRDFILSCEGERTQVRRLLDRFRATLAVLPSEAFEDAVYFTERDLVVRLGVHRTDGEESGGRATSPWEFTLHVYDAIWARRTR